MEDIERLSKTITGRTARRIFEQAVPMYLSTGRTLSMLDERFALGQPLDRFREMAETNPSFRAIVLNALRVGLSTAKLRRTDAVSAGNSEISRGLAVIIDMVQSEITDLLKNEADYQARLQVDVARSRKGQSTSWADAPPAKSPAMQNIERAMRDDVNDASLLEPPNPVPLPPRPTVPSRQPVIKTIPLSEQVPEYAQAEAQQTSQPSRPEPSQSLPDTPDKLTRGHAESPTQSIKEKPTGPERQNPHARLRL